MNLIIRPITPADYADVARITAAAYLEAGYFASVEEEYMQEILRVAERAAAAEVIVAVRDGVVVGSATLARAGEEWANVAQAHELEFRLLVVDPAVQRSGAGAALVRHILARAATLPAVHGVALTTGDDWHSAHALYQKLGFQRAPDRDWPVSVGGNAGKMLRVYTLAV